MKIFVFGNGNLKFEMFLKLYHLPVLEVLKNQDPTFILGDFRGVDTMMMELLKNLTPQVIVNHIGEKPRYYPDKYKTYANEWAIRGGFTSDLERDASSIEVCTHFLAFDFNSDQKRKSGTKSNIETCLLKGKIDLGANLNSYS